MKCACNLFQTIGICYHTGYKPIFRKDIELKVNDILANLDKDFAEGWRPNEGDTIVGRVVDVSKGWSDYINDYYPIITVADETSNSEKAIHCFHHALRLKVVELRPDVGERIAVRFTGTVPTKDGKRTVKTYKVSVEGRSAGNVWDTLSAQEPTKINPQALAAAQEAVQEKKEDDLPF